jgi:Photosynthetic reaction centre cytochrome C subunit
MNFNRKFIVVAAMAAIVTTAVAFTAPAPPDNGFKNLKILPKDISHEQLGKIMHGFNDALGVKCNFCHAPSKDTSQHHPDFASDDKPEKNIARSMMKMTVKINKKFFEAKHPFIGDSTLSVTCITCHHGSPHPEENGGGEHMEHMGDHPQGPPPPPGGGNH